MTSYNGISITADAIGNPLSWHDGSSMSWQHGRQLASYTDSDGVKTTYTYDVDGIRTSKTTNGVTTKYYVIDGTLRRMTDGTNTLQFVYGNDLSSVIFNGTEYWYVFNAQGDVIGLINVAGEYVVEYAYDAWGKPLSKTGSLADTLGTLNPFRYRGYVYDEETGFYYCQTRYYDPEVGRFLNCDEYVSTGNGFLGHNMFGYCKNNPINSVDDKGDSSVLLAAVIGGVVNLTTSYISAKITGQDFGLADAAIAVGTGVLSSFGGSLHLLAGAISGISTMYSVYKQTNSVGAALASGVITAAVSTMTVGYGAEAYLKQELDLVTSTVVDLTFGLGGNIASSAMVEGITQVNNSQNSGITLTTPVTPTKPTASTNTFRTTSSVTSSNMYVVPSAYPVVVTSRAASPYTVRI